MLAWPPVESEPSAGVVGWNMELRGGGAIEGQGSYHWHGLL